MSMRPGMVMGIALAFLGGMATAIMTGNALVRMQQQGRSATDRTELAKSARAAQELLDKDDFLAKMDEANRRIAAAVEPSVVHVSIEQEGKRGPIKLGAGSGWVYDDRGHIVTNAHVVNEAPRMLVHFANGRAYAARVVGADQATDVAVIRVEGDAPLVPARRATGWSPQQGDHIYAFGSPFGFKFSMSQGIISGLSREPGEVSLRDTYTNYIQSDAAINPGNSGGPLCDIRGRVVGMNVAIASDARDGVPTARGVGFAIPLTTIEPIVDQLINHGSVSKGFLGVNMPAGDDENDAALKAREYNGAGVIITGLVVGAPAESAGVQVGDVVVRVDSKEVRTVPQFRAMIATQRPGEKIALGLWRDGEKRDLTIVLGDLDSLGAITKALQDFGLIFTVGGGLGVLGVIDDSPAEQAGFARGQSILSVGQRRMRTLDDFVWTLAAEGFQKGMAVAVTVKQGGRERTLQMKMTPAP